MCTLKCFCAFSQNLSEFAINKIDKLDGKADKKITLESESLSKSATYTFIHLQDSIRKTLIQSYSSDFITKTDKLLYNELIKIDAKSLVNHIEYKEKYDLFFKWLKAANDEEKVKLLLQKPLKSFKIIPFIEEEKSALEFTTLIAYENPTLTLENFRYFKNSTNKNSLVETSVIADPLSAKKYFLPSNEIFQLLQKSENEEIKLLLDIFSETGRNSKSLALSEAVKQGTLTPKSAHEIAQSGGKNYIDHLLKIRAEENPLGSFSIDRELNTEALRYIRQINDQHENYNTSERFASLKNFSAAELYTLIVYSEEEIFTSTFNGIFNQLISQMKKEQLTGNQLMQKTGYNRFRTFVKISAGYGKLDSFLQTFSDNSARESFLIKFITGIDESKNFPKEAVAVADAMGSISDKKMLDIFSVELLNSYAQSEQKTIYGLLISVFREKATMHKDSIQKIGSNYPLPEINQLSNSTLLGIDSTHVQWHFFYDDEDGKMSFGSFLSHFKDGNWNINFLPEYVVISSAKGRKVSIFANKPEFERSAPQAIRDTLEKWSKSADMVVHRGHSFYVDYTIENIDDNAKIVLLGSCGSYHRISDILYQSPTTHIISTRQIGTMHVNNPLIFEIAELIRKGDDVVWKSLWKNLEQRFPGGGYTGNKFREYIGPHQNLGARFIQAYREFESKPIQN